ncbi:15-hydroxyprostaglandin dehydrogenase [NAD(+)]-like [Vanessa cardui]|uniref:15-hydroxyprostaglandin dehydrogenase [NAD(+)]-like n=1 Tax=Vanessa cardui TaxID=171605 RepID=UPI001F135934|nr:15-hydroxyprostaglandin dehydrogenase [NAD(+)]-like [Vanessa cardui]
MFDITNKVVFITGGSIGIGAKVIEFLLDENVKHVANLDIAEDKGIALQNQLNKKYGANKVKFIKGDVTNQDDLYGAYQAIIEEQGYIDVVINNAGIMNDSKDTYKKEIEVNVTALISSTLKAMDVMRKDEGGKGGVVMNMSSIAALVQDPMIPIYFGTKSAVLQFSNCIGMPEYYDRTGVSVLVICFGATDTSLLSKEKLGNFDKEVEKRLLETISTHPLQKVESAARGVVDAIKQGESGSTWLSIADRPVRDVTSTIKKAYGILSELVYE